MELIILLVLAAVIFVLFLVAEEVDKMEQIKKVEPPQQVQPIDEGNVIQSNVYNENTLIFINNNDINYEIIKKVEVTASKAKIIFKKEKEDSFIISPNYEVFESSGKTIIRIIIEEETLDILVKETNLIKKK